MEIEGDDDEEGAHLPKRMERSTLNTRTRFVKGQRSHILSELRQWERNLGDQS